MKPLRILLLVMASAVPAAAQTPDPPCTGQRYGLMQLFVGVSTETVALTCPAPSGPANVSTAHVIRIDLGAPGLSFVTSGQGRGGPKQFDLDLPTAFIAHAGVQVAFNANLFTNCCIYEGSGQPVETELIGLEVSGGKILSAVQANRTTPQNCPPPPYPFDATLIVTGKMLRIQTIDRAEGLMPLDAAVTGSHMLVAGGQIVAPSGGCPDEFFGPNARTLVGLSADNAVLWIAAVDLSTSGGVTLMQAAQLMTQLGAANAINLDGGGSTSLAIEDAAGKARLLNLPKDGASSCTFAVGGTQHCERYVGAIFGVHAQRR